MLTALGQTEEGAALLEKVVGAVGGVGEAVANAAKPAKKARPTVQ
jgi:hypothetical protein